MMRISDRVRSIRPSPTLEATARAIALREQGIDLVDLGAGEPDFDTPEHIKQAAVEALAAGATKYTAVGGTEELKRAIVTKLRRDNGLQYSTSEVVVSCGGKHSLYNTFLALFQEGDEVILPSPYWTTYPDILTLAGARAVILEGAESDGFRISAEGLRRAITPRTRGFVLNSPSNPTGIAYGENELLAILAVLQDHPEVILVSDDVYERMLYDGRSVPPHPGVLAPDLRERLVISNSVSKSYAMTGWRIGYTAAPAAVIKAITTLQGQSTSNASSVAQAAAAAALMGPQECVDRMVREFEKRRDFVVARLREIPGLTVVRPDGAFYVFPNVSRHFGKRWSKGEIRSGGDMALYLLEEGRVALVGGEAFGSPDHVRISYANSLENLRKALDRVDEALRALA
ncbi:MAG: pyridoxal phosphate-dependent aminotransferase [Candidatus Binatia bacterium]